jgi:hypothetical protein
VFHNLCDLDPLYKLPKKDVGKRQPFQAGGYKALPQTIDILDISIVCGV